MLTVREVAVLTEVPEHTLRRHLRSGRLPGQKAGRDWLVSPEDADTFRRTYTPYDTLRRSTHHG